MPERQSLADPDLTALAASLADVARNLDDHIERRAGEIAQLAIAVAAARADRILAKERAERAAESQRKDDLIVELRRRLDAQARHVANNHGKWESAQAAIHRIQMLKPWTNEDRRQFVFADDLWAALNPEIAKGQVDA